MEQLDVAVVVMCQQRFTKNFSSMAIRSGQLITKTKVRMFYLVSRHWMPDEGLFHYANAFLPRLFLLV